MVIKSLVLKNIFLHTNLLFYKKYNMNSSFQTVYQKVIQNALNYGEKYHISIDKDFSFFKLIEEVGEFSQARLIFEWKSRPEKFLDKETAKAEIAKELADVVGMAFVNAHVLGIDLEKALKIKWIKE